MTGKSGYSVSDVAARGDDWYFVLHCGSSGGSISFAFRSRKEANVSRRLMKEIITRTAAVPSAEIQPARVPVSWGELIDKITILEIKRSNLENEDALKNIGYELALLQAVAEPILANRSEIAALKLQLRILNEKLWAIENFLREKEARLEFDAGFIELARSVYKTNDERSALKKTINVSLKSTIVEEKSYQRRDANRA